MRRLWAAALLLAGLAGCGLEAPPLTPAPEPKADKAEVTISVSGSAGIQKRL